MKKIFIYICLALLFSSNSFAENKKQTVNDYLNDGYKIVKDEARNNHQNSRVLTLLKKTNIAYCVVYISLEGGKTHCYEA